MTNRSRYWLLTGYTLLVLAAGLSIGYYAARQGSQGTTASPIREYVGEARHVNFASDALEFDVQYPGAYVNPPELTILTEEMNHGFVYQLIEQRRDGFRIKIGSSMRRADKPDGAPWLRYRARGVPAAPGQ